VLDDLRSSGRINKPVRPWLGLYSTEIETPSDRDRRHRAEGAGRPRRRTQDGDVVLSSAGEDVDDARRIHPALE